MRGVILVDGKRPSEWMSAEQGFIDQDGKFCSRQKAWKIAEAAGQIRNQSWTKGTLFSEDLY